MSRTTRLRPQWVGEHFKITEERDAGCHRKCPCRAPKWHNGKERLPYRDRRRVGT